MSGLLGPALSATLFLAVIAVLGLATVMAKGRGRAFPRLGRGRRLEVIERIELGDRRFLALVRLDRRELLVGGSSQSLAVLAGPEPIAAEQDAVPVAPGSSFAAMVSRLVAGKSAPAEAVR